MAASRIHEFKKTPIPEDLKNRPIQLSDNARQVLRMRYLRKDEEGEPLETEQEMFWRVAYHVALAEKDYGASEKEVEKWARRYFDLLTELRFFPNSPTFTGAGTPLGQLAACFVLNIDDDMGRTGQGIFETLRNAALIQQTGGGNGFSFSRLRPRGAMVKSSGGKATGRVGFLQVYDKAFGEIAQGGCLTPDTLVFTEKGLLRLDEIVKHDEPGWRSHRIQVPTDEGLRTSTGAYNNGVAPVFKIYTDDGLELTGTANHKAKVMTDDGEVWKRFDELEMGDALIVKLGQYQGQFQVLRKPEQQHTNQKMPTLPSILDEELAFFLGYMAGDGFIASDKDDYRIGVRVARNSYLIDEIPLIIGHLFGEDVTIEYQRNNKNAKNRSVTLVINNRVIKEFLLINGLNQAQSADVAVARRIRQSPPEVVGAYLRGLFEASGTLNQNRPQLISSSPRLIQEVAMLVIGLGSDIKISENKLKVWNRELWWQKIGCHALSRFQRVYRKKTPHPTMKPHPVLSRGQGESPEPQKSPGFDRSVWFVAVADVKKVGESLTLDIEVEDNHTYLANGIVSHNSRRGANMAVLRVDHPDIRDFIRCKTVEGAIENFNISVGMTDEFMQAVENDTDFDLINPQNGEVWETVRARELFDLIVKHAHQNGEPGVLFLDAANRENPVPHLYELESTNPCFTGDCRIATEFGLLRLDEFAESGLQGFVASDNRAPADKQAKSAGKTPGVALRPASPAWMTRQNVPVMKLTTKGGFQITATPDHKFLTPNGYIELQYLNIDDKVLLQSGEGAWSRNYELPNVEYIQERMSKMALSGDHASGNVAQRQDFQDLYANIPHKWSHGLGLVMGWLVGDGWLTENGTHSYAGMVFGKDSMREIIQTTMSEWFGFGYLQDRGSVLQLTYGQVPFEFFHSLGVKVVRAHEKRVPDFIWTAPREAVIGFLQGLFTADGTVLVKELNDDCSVRLASSSPELLRDVQLLLSNFGIIGRIHLRRHAGKKLMPDGKGGMKEYAYKAQYELILGRVNRDRFADLIGFIDADKQEKVETYIKAKKRRPVAEKFVDVIVNIEDAGITDVYDLTQYQTHNLLVNSFVVRNCGEQFLGPFENCCLGSINLSQHIGGNSELDWSKLQKSVESSVNFLDHVVTANAYVPAIPQLREAAERVRRIGLGIMGLSDVMYAMGVRYGSQEGQEFASQVMEFIRYHAMKTSIKLAKQKGAFPAIQGSRYDPDDLQWTIPEPLVAHVTDWKRPKLNWKKLEKDLKKHGIRNGAQLTVAPTGTISTVSGCEGYGCEPVFALAYTRYVNVNEGNSDDRQALQYTSPLFENALKQAELSEDQIQDIVEEVNRTGTCQHIEELPENIRRTFVVAGDISVEEHIRMQAALQAWTDNAISKTINAPIIATEQDVAEAYMLGWRLGCKGLTVYVTGSREKVVLETKATQEQKEQVESFTETALIPAPSTAIESGKPKQHLLFNEDLKPRPHELIGKTYRLETPAGTTYVTINENGYGEGQPFEVFIHTGKAGTEVMALSEGMGRLISLILRLSSTVSPRKRIKQIVRQLEGIGGKRATGFGANRVHSLPDGLAQILHEYLATSPDVDPNPADRHAHSVQQKPLPLAEKSSTGNGTKPSKASAAFGQKIGDICPSCGAATLVSEEGCRKCYSCSFSEC